MSQVKLTKNELRIQQIKLQQLTRYLPTLQLKKAMLQQEVNLVSQQLEEAKDRFELNKGKFSSTAQLLNVDKMRAFLASAKVLEVKTSEENIAGIDVPLFEDVFFATVAYQGAEVPLWWDFALVELKSLIKEKEKMNCLNLKRMLLEKELREVSIRVNLFEKVLIPRTCANIKKIKIFLGDLQLSAVAQAKVAKSKIEAKRKIQVGER